ncbi:Uncharacterized protein PRO82_000228 [Candidatus Protochlamydia amoebophila]|nr:Uncharacterized protein [Candidatus Protochlamydia amoebophila]
MLIIKINRIHSLIIEFILSLNEIFAETVTEAILLKQTKILTSTISAKLILEQSSPAKAKIFKFCPEITTNYCSIWSFSLSKCYFRSRFRPLKEKFIQVNKGQALFKMFSFLFN